MPTIDELAPATAASDSDELLSNQNGISRKVTRAQLVAGLQPQLGVPSGKLLGRSSAGTGGPEQVSVGSNLVLNAGTLSATAAPFQIAKLPSGAVPAAGDLVPLGQGSTNVAVSYAQFASTLGKIGGIDASAMTVTPSGGSTQTLAAFAATSLSKAGGAMTGPLTLAADPTASFQAATKQYVDSQVATALPKAGGVLSGPLTLPANPTSALQAASKQYVDTQVQASLPLAGGTLTGAVSAPSLSVAGAATVGGKLAAAAIAANQVGTSGGTLAAGLALQRVGTGAADASVLNSTLVVTHAGGPSSGYTNANFPTVVNDAVDSSGNLIDGIAGPVRAISTTLIVNSVAGSGAAGSGPQHVAVAAAAIKNAPPGGYPAGRTGPQIFGMLVPVLDTTNQPSTIGNATVGAQLNLGANNLDPSNRRVGYQVVLNPAVSLASGGMPAEWSSALSVLVSADSWFKWHFAPQGNYSIAVLDTRLANGGSAKILTSLSTPGTTIAVDPVLPFVSAGLRGQSVSSTNAAQVQVGSSIYTLIGATLDGAGLTSGKLTFSSPVSIADAKAGNVVVGQNRTIWLGSGQQLALDTQGAANLLYDTGLGAIRSTASVQVGGALGVQGGASFNGGTVVLPPYTVAALPPASAGALAYATNGRKPGEAAAAGSGVLVWGTGAKQWLSILSGTPVQA
jgi:hypothetical protein